MGENLPNHSYVDLTLVGTNNSDPGNTVRCIIDLGTCCRGVDGIHTGEWLFPNGSAVQSFSFDDSIYKARGAQWIILRRRINAMGPSGIYRCDIPTDAVHDDNDLSVREQSESGPPPETRGDSAATKLSS